MTHQNSKMATRGTDRTDRSPLRFLETARRPTDKTAKSPFRQFCQCPPGLFSKKSTCKPAKLRYTPYVPETTGNLDWRPEQIKADNRRRAVFLRPHIKRLQWSGLGEGALALAGILDRRYANLAMCPATPIGVGGRVIRLDQGGRTMPSNIHAHPEQTSFPNSLTSLVREAPHSGAIAGAYQDGLAITGDTLRRMADLKNWEVNDGTGKRIDKRVVDLSEYRARRTRAPLHVREDAPAPMDPEEALAEIAHHLMMAVRVITGRKI
ncbi:hypothetical protein QFZ94_003370 [Paraburkholderia sp. JPY465]|uniref:hypothetical protein n=1 Tax=Paraburkholderia sp. JPY465 TaxID=3042285 RepID=UPI003D1CD18A